MTTITILKENPKSLVGRSSLGTEDVEVAAGHSGLRHSDLSLFKKSRGSSQFPTILGHELLGRVTAVDPNAKGLKVGQRVGVGLNFSNDETFSR